MFDRQVRMQFTGTSILSYHQSTGLLFPPVKPCKSTIAAMVSYLMQNWETRDSKLDNSEKTITLADPTTLGDEKTP